MKFEGSVDIIDKKKRNTPPMVIKLSNIPNSGNGLFTKENIEKGQHLGWYYGDIYESHPNNDSDYILEIQMKPCWVSASIWNNKKNKNMFIDGCPKDKSLVFYKFSMLNHSNSPNVKFLQNGRIVSLRKIINGEELLVNYGNEYWD